MNEQTLTTKIALITGGSRGLGKSMAEHLAARGADVIFTYHSAEAEAGAVVKSLEAKGRRGEKPSRSGSTFARPGRSPASRRR